MLALFSLDNLVDTDKTPISLHKLTYERAAERNDGKGGKWGFLMSSSFDFAPSGFTLNQVETSFVLYGRGGICVGNLPSEMSKLESKEADV